MRRFAVALVTVLTVGLPPGRAATSEQVCAAAKLLATTHEFSAKISCRRRAVARGASPDPACLQLAADKFAAAFARAESAGGCAPGADQAALQGQVDSCVADVAAGVASSGSVTTSERRCTSAKLLAAARKLSAKTSCERSAVRQGTPSDPACLQTAEGRFDAAFARAGAGGGCASGDDGATLEGRIDACLSDLAASIPVTTTGSSTTATSTTVPSTTSTTITNDPAQLCVDDINAHRASIGLPPYARWTAAEACASGEARTDAMNNRPHSAFPSCGELAQNECPGWPGPPGEMIGPCLDAMWAEGPGSDFHTHGHYINMTSTQYTMVACGFYVRPNGDVWAAQDFR